MDKDISLVSLSMISKAAIASYFHPIAGLTYLVGKAISSSENPLSQNENDENRPIERSDNIVQEHANLNDAEVKARKIIHAWAVGSTAVGWVPGSMFTLMDANLQLIDDVAKAFGVESYSIEEIKTAIGTEAISKIVVSETLSLIPGIGWVAKAALAGGIANAMGEAIINYFKARSPYT